MSDSGRTVRRMRPCLFWSAILLLAGLIVGCERPFVEERRPEIEVLSPDLSVVQPQRDILVEVRANSQNAVDSVLLNGIALIPGDEEGVFSRPLRLNPGLNTLVFRAFDLSGSESIDTVYAVALPTEAAVGQLRLPEPRGGHTALRMADGRFMVAGGAPLPNQPASNAAWIYSPTDLRSAPTEYFMLHRRTEHTATRLPDGRILMIGGCEIMDPPTVNELVEGVELFDPDVSEFVPVPVAGDPVRRCGHTTILFRVGRQGGQVDLFFYLYGGWGDVQYRPQARMGIRSDIRVFQFRNDSLVALGPTIGPNVDAIVDHTATPLVAQIGNRGEYLIGGSIYVTDESFDDVTFQAVLATGSGIRLESTGLMRVHRSGHAAERMVEGEVFIFGGRMFSLTSAIRENEVYYSRIRQFFPMSDEQGLLQKRWGHTATNWDGTRILIVGGFGETGAGLQTSEWFEVDRGG